MSLRRKTLTLLQSIAVAPPTLGATYVLLLAAWAGQRSASDDADLGDDRRAGAVEVFIAHRFASEITRMTIGIVATALSLGLTLGLVAALLLRLRHGGTGPRRRSWIEALGLVAWLHAALVAWAMADSPQLYASRWYAKGGLARTAQVLATDVVGTRGVLALTALALLLYVRPKQLVLAAFDAARSVRRALARVSPRALAILFFVTAGGLGLSAGHEPIREAYAGPSDTARPPNILILAADSLRADHVEYGVAPNLARLASRGTRFERAYVSLPRTFPSWVTILTGRHGHHHGVRSMFPTWEQRAKDFDALPARFARAGYTTGVISDYAGDIFGRIDLGFGRVDAPSFDFRQLIRQRALERETPLLPVLHSHLGRSVFPVMRELNDAADPRLLADDVETALRAARGKPFFFTVFFSTAHFPYAAPAPYYAKYTDPAYRGRFKYHKPVGLNGEVAPNAEDIRQIRALYDGTVTAIDDAAGRVLATLERLGLSKNTIVVITADHGETLYDHGHGQGHGDHLFGDEGTHVPLVIYDPRVDAPRQIPKVVREIDLAPTLYELAGVPPPDNLDGESLAAAVRGGAIASRFAFAETELWFTEDIPSLPSELRIPYPGIMSLTELDSRHNAEIVLKKDMMPATLMARHRMVRDERFKLVYVPTRQGVKYMLFDTTVDPGETTDVAAARPEEVKRLRAELWAWMLKDPQMEQRDGYLVPRGPR